MKRRSLFTTVAALVCAVVAPVAMAADAAEQAGIRRLIGKTWDKPGSKVVVDPIVVSGSYAVAGWTQQGHGGRALLSRDAHGNWQVAACAGDGLKDPKILQQAGVASPVARELANRLAQAEARIDPRRKALFSTFEGMVRMDAAGDTARDGKEKAQ